MKTYKSNSFSLISINIFFFLSFTFHSVNVILFRIELDSKRIICATKNFQTQNFLRNKTFVR